MYIDRKLIQTSLGHTHADLVIKNGRLVNVYTREIYQADVVVTNNRIAAAGRNLDASIGLSTEVIDAEGKYLVPGLIDSHIHPEVSKVTLTRLGNAIVPRGTTSIMASLDQIGVVTGLSGIRFVLDEVNKTPLKIFHSAPSRLPYTTPASTIAYPFGPKEHNIAQEWPEAVGIWEYMASSIEDFDEKVFEAVDLAFKNRLSPHGHMPVTTGRVVSACAAAGTRDDHESYSAIEMIEKLQNGIYGLMRRGTHSDNIPALVQVITELQIPTNHLALCTDDTDCIDISELGLIDSLVRNVIRLGVDPITAIQMGSINAAEAYRVDHMVGSITPGRIADILLVSDLSAFTVDSVVANGKLVAKHGQMIQPCITPEFPGYFLNTVKLDRPIETTDLLLATDEMANAAKVLCIHIDLDEGLLSQRRDAVLPVLNGKIYCDPEQGVNFISVTERHTGSGKTSSAFITGFDLKHGAIATSLSPDDDNIICIGANADDMAFAINHLAKIGGGQVAVEGKKVIAKIQLPLAGLMSDISVEEMAKRERTLNDAARHLGTHLQRPFFFLIFLSITSIPDFAMTDKGLVEYKSRSVINPILELIKE
jgi:adenine deaminase